MSENPVYKTVEEIINKAKTANGKTIESLNVHNRDLSGSNKGVIGQIIEEGVFEYPINSRAEPDFANVGVELKVTGIKKNNDNSFSAKERLVLNIIDYMSEGTKNFQNSSFWHKNKSLLLMFYYYDKQIELPDYKIIDSILYTYPKEDLSIIKNDWKIINDKITNGNAHLISESDTMYLAACTKGANGQAVRPQPFSDELAKQRAYCLKPSYVNHILRSYGIDKEAQRMFGFANVNKAINDMFSDEKLSSNNIVTAKELENNTFEHVIEKRVRPFIGISEDAFISEYNINGNAKHKFELIISRMLNCYTNINRADEFLKANIVVKTVRIEENDKIIESMSLPCFKYEDIVKEEWADSELRNYFYETKFMFVVFKKFDGYYRFKGIKFWNMPIEILDKELYEVWLKTKDIISKGLIVKGYFIDKNGTKTRITNFPGKKDNPYCHVRPHARNAKDVYPLPVTDVLSGQKYYTKHCFWLNNSFVLDILKDVLDK